MQKVYDGAWESECHSDGNSFSGTVILVHHRHLTYEETEAEKKVALPRSHSGSREGRN